MINRSRKSLVSLLAALFAEMLFIAITPAGSYAEDYGDFSDLQQQINSAEDGIATTIVLNESYRAEDPDDEIKRGNEITIGRNKII